MLLLSIQIQDMQKQINLEEMRQKQEEAETEHGQRREISLILDISFIIYKIIDRDYELIRRFKTTTASVHDSYVDLTEENEVVYRDRGYFGAKTKGYNTTMKRAVKGHTLGIKDILRNKRISSKRVPGERVYSVTKEIFTAGRVFVTTVKRVNLKMLCTAFCYNLHQLRTLKIKKVY